MEMKIAKLSAARSRSSIDEGPTAWMPDERCTENSWDAGFCDELFDSGAASGTITSEDNVEDGFRFKTSTSECMAG